MGEENHVRNLPFFSSQSFVSTYLPRPLYIYSTPQLTRSSRVGSSLSDDEIISSEPRTMNQSAIIAPQPEQPRSYSRPIAHRLVTCDGSHVQQEVARWSGANSVLHFPPREGDGWNT